MNLLFRPTVDREIDAELQAHIEMKAADNIAAGMPPEEARRDALLKFGNPTVMKEKVAGVDVALGLASVVSDIHYACRKLRKSPGFAITIITTLALGIGANTAIFSIVDAVLLRPLPYKNADRLVVVWQTDAAHRGVGAWFDPYREFEEWQRGSRSFEKLAAMSWAATSDTMIWRGKPVALLALPASSNFFSLLGAEAQIGRTFRQADLNSPCTLVLAYPFWQQKLGAPKDIAGQTLTVGPLSCVVVGVMPQQFAFYPKQANAWSLITPASAFVQKPWDSMTGVFGLLKPGVTHAQAEAELDAMQKRVSPEAPASLSTLASATPIVLSLQDNFTWLAGRNLRRGLWSTVRCSQPHLAHGVLERGRSAAWPRDGTCTRDGHSYCIGFRPCAAHPANVDRVVSAGPLRDGHGVLLALLMLHWFRAVNPVELPPGNVVSLHWQVLLFAALLGFSSAIVFGLLPAWQASRVDLNSVLKNNQRGMGASASAQRASQVLVVMQIALSLMLFVGAGLLGASMWRMASTPLGYRTNHVLTATVNLPQGHYGDNEGKARFAAELSRRVSAMPGVEAVAEASYFTPGGENPLSVEGDPGRFSAGGIATQSVSANFFDAMQIPSFRGRVFNTQDGTDTRQVGIVNQALANRYFPHDDPVGHAVKLSRADDPSRPWLTIIGVVADVKVTTVFQEMGYVVQPTVYRPLTQDAPGSLALMVLAKDKSSGLISGIEEQLAAMDRSLLLADPGTLEDQQSAVLSQPRFRTVLFASFAGLALLLAVVGLYGVLTQMVAQRTREMAIRIAVGANRGEVLGRVLRKAIILAALGITLGVTGSALAVRALAGLLYGVRAENTAMFVLASIVLTLTTLVASWNPAWRAANIDPMQALRSE